MLPQRVRPCIVQRRREEKRASGARFHWENRKSALTTSLLRKCGWLERIAGSNVASPAKGMAAWKTFFFSSCRAASARWWRASRCCCGHWSACRDVPGNPVRHHEPGSSPRIRFVTTRATDRAPFFRSAPSRVEAPARRRAFSRDRRPQTKSPVFRPGFYLNPSNPFRRLRPPRQRRRHRLRHRPRRLRRQLRSPRSWRRGAGSWRAGSRFP